MLGDSKNNIVKQFIWPAVVMVTLAVISTYLAFIGREFYINPDGIFHMARLESIYQALAAGEWPSRLNFIGFQHQGAAVTGMYPWLSAVMFILPRFVLSPMWALAVGFIVMNLLTIFFTWALMRRLTDKTLLHWLGVVLYQFNGYHFIIMYSRMALGEAIGYMVLPLILLGLIDIWQKRRWGWIILGLGMAIVANGHILSLVLFTVMIVFFEIYRLVTRKFTLAEFGALLKSALLALVLSSYTLYTMIEIMVQNTLMPPSVRWDTLTVPNYIMVTLTNDFKEHRDTTMGLVIGILMLIFLVLALKHIKRTWARWILAANIILLCSFDFVLGPELINTPFSTLQFSMRFLTFVALFLTVGIVLYFNDRSLNGKEKSWIYVIMVTVFLGAVVGMIQHNIETKSSHLTKRLTGQTYHKCIAKHPVLDYVLRDTSVDMKKLDFTKKADARAFRASRLYDEKVKNQFKYVNSTFDSVTWVQDTKVSGMTKLPVVGYAGVDYRVLVNDVSTHYERKEGQLFVPLSVGHNKIVISGR